jgi:hypothetical protein
MTPVKDPPTTVATAVAACWASASRHQPKPIAIPIKQYISAPRLTRRDWSKQLKQLAIYLGFVICTSSISVRHIVATPALFYRDVDQLDVKTIGCQQKSDGMDIKTSPGSPSNPTSPRVRKRDLRINMRLIVSGEKRCSFKAFTSCFRESVSCALFQVALMNWLVRL